ncbi:MAG: DUF962 domain-containing protein [Aquidulcibacter sp.]|jgi:uncharacterized membrane protein YGL010W|uniref:Mpo1-like protein n=1 Tax=Aquidulcibacter sp. TaxID=2052990 RepID=UPI0022C8DFAB|nr:DUF962 domain-containing protein [Aquidulcibacter sp.]
MSDKMRAELAIYDAIHVNPINRAIHAVGIPVIMFAVLGFAALIGQSSGFLNGGLVLSLVGGVIIGRYSVWCGFALALFAYALTLGAQALHAQFDTTTAAIIYGAAFVVGWIVQFIGHGIEKAGPAFGSRPINLLLGPVSVLNDFLPLIRPAPWKDPNVRP